MHEVISERVQLKIIQKKKRKRGHIHLVSQDPLLVITYWDNDEAEKEGKDTPISIYQFAADYYCEDLSFV